LKALKKTICVVTGTRAEFGLLRPVMQAIDHHAKLTLQTVVTGSHLLPPHTWKHVRDAGFAIDAKVKMQQAGHTGRSADAAALGRGITGLSKAFDALAPDIVLVLGDRIEAFAAASAASVGGLHLAHIHGGDRAQGVADEAMRHAITKLAHLHFPATAQSKKRITRLGESPDHVWNLGSPAIDGLPAPLPKADRNGIIVLHHPVGDPPATEQKTMQTLLRAAASFAKKHDEPLLVFEPNHDPGRDGITAAIDEAGLTDDQRTAGLPRDPFIEKLAAARLIIGNSSAGLIEAAALKTPAVNVGPRQSGREKPGSVVDCGTTAAALKDAIHSACRLDLRRMRHPYGSGNAGEQIADQLARLDRAAIPLRKRNQY